MKKIAIVLACIIAFPFLTGFSPENEITVATWNILHGNGAIESQKHQIRHMRADVVALQEVDEKTDRVIGKSCLEVLSNGVYPFKIFGKEQDYKNGEFGLGFLSKNYLFNTKISFPEYEGSIERDGIMKSTIRKDGKLISVYNVHFSYAYYWVRERQMQQAAEIFAKDPCKYKILMGDFNVEDIKEFDVFKDCNILSDYKNPVETYKGDDWSTKCIDNIIYSENLVLQKYEVDETKYSDHKPLIAKFKMI